MTHKDGTCDGLMNGSHHVITDPKTGKERIPYARIMVQRTISSIAQDYAKKKMAERYPEVTEDDPHYQAVADEMASDFTAGYLYKRGYEQRGTENIIIPEP